MENNRSFTEWLQHIKNINKKFKCCGRCIQGDDDCIYEQYNNVEGVDKARKQSLINSYGVDWGSKIYRVNQVYKLNKHRNEA